MNCKHPDPTTVPWLFCRTCGYFVEGVRIGDATDEVLKERLSEHVGKPVVVESGVEMEDD